VNDACNDVTRQPVELGLLSLERVDLRAISVWVGFDECPELAADAGALRRAQRTNGVALPPPFGGLASRFRLDLLDTLVVGRVELNRWAPSLGRRSLPSEREVDARRFACSRRDDPGIATIGFRTSLIGEGPETATS
jgi:hypothetical protein